MCASKWEAVLNLVELIDDATPREAKTRKLFLMNFMIVSMSFFCYSYYVISINMIIGVINLEST